MQRILQNPATVLAASFLMFFGTLFLSLRALPLGRPSSPAEGPVKSADDDPSWRFRNPEIDQWISQIQAERDALATKEQDLKEWEARLAAESREIAAVTQAVTRTQEGFDKRVLLFTDQQKENAKREIKVISDMSPDGAIALLNAMPDDQVAQLLYLLKPDAASAILEAMSKQSDAGAKRAAALTGRMNDILSVPSTNNFASNASH